MRHGTTILLAALEIATGRVTGAGEPRHRDTGFLAFLKHIARVPRRRRAAPGDGQLRAHKHPRVLVHFTPKHASWMNLVEVWFFLIERRAIHRGTFGSVKELHAKIRAYIDGWNDRRHPFTWAKTAEQVLKTANRKKTSDAEH